MRTISLEKVEDSTALAYYDKNIAVITDFRDKHLTDKLLLDGLVTILIRRGSVSANINDTHCTMHAGDLFLCTPRNIIENRSVSPDLQIYGCFLSIPFAHRMMEMTDLDIIQHGINVRQHIMHLVPEQQQLYINTISLLADILNMPPSAHKDKSVQSLLMTMTYLLADFATGGSLAESCETSSSSADYLVRQFLNMLVSPETRFRSVNQFAERMHVTPKYFSAACKAVTGKSASHIINEMYVREAKILLRDSKMSIKQVADRLGFRNQSHFGTFIRRQTGLSPQSLRVKL